MVARHMSEPEPAPAPAPIIIDDEDEREIRREFADLVIEPSEFSQRGLQSSTSAVHRSSVTTGSVCFDLVTEIAVWKQTIPANITSVPRHLWKQTIPVNSTSGPRWRRWDQGSMKLLTDLCAFQPARLPHASHTQALGSCVCLAIALLTHRLVVVLVVLAAGVIRI